MTQHPFEREFSEQEAAKLNAEQKPQDTEKELTDEDADQVAGGIIMTPPTKGLGEVGGGVSKVIIEAGIS